jgi:hypothetical protein
MAYPAHWPKFSKSRYKHGWWAYNVNYTFTAPTEEELDATIAEYFTRLDDEAKRSDYTPAFKTLETGCCFFCKQPIVPTGG